MERKPNSSTQERGSKTQERAPKQNSRKVSEYGRQLREKQKVKEIYGMRERQFKRFFAIATRSQESTGEALLNLLERRLDNVVYRAKLSSTRPQARQIIVHGHIQVNGRRVYSPSFLVSVSDVITIAPGVENKAVFLDQVFDKRLAAAAKAPDWIELDKKERKGQILRLPVRADIQTPIEEHLIVELYSK